MRTFNHEHATNCRVEYAAMPGGSPVTSRLIVETDLPFDASSAEYQLRAVSDLEIKASTFAQSEGIGQVEFVRIVP